MPSTRYRTIAHSTSQMETFPGFSVIVNRVIVIEFVLTIVRGGPPWPEMDTESSNSSNSSTASTASSTLNWTDLDPAIAAFIREYETRHGVKVETERHLRKTRKFEAGIGPMYHVYQLKFVAHQKSKEKVFSSVIVKVAQHGKNGKRELRLFHYGKEQFMYTSVLPVINELSPYGTFSPDFYVRTDSHTLITENLRESQFYTAEDTLMNLPGSVLVFEQLARFHALSVFYLYEHGSTTLEDLTIANGLGKLKFGLGDHKSMHLAFETHVGPYLPNKARQQFDQMIQELHTIIQTGYSVNHTGYNVIVHGDPNRTNVFFQDDVDNYMATCKFIDFQYSRVGSPVIDLVNYLITSVRFEVFAEHSDELFNVYLAEFRSVVEDLGLEHVKKSYSVENLRADLHKYKLFFLYKLTFEVPLLCTRYSTLVSSSGEENNYYDLWKSEQFISVYANWMAVILNW